MTDLDLDEIKYKTNPLTEVIARIDFVRPVEAIIANLPSEIKKAAQETFPIAEPKPAVLQGFRVSPSKDTEILPRTEYTEWNFYGRQKEKKLCITPQAVWVSHKQYETYEAFRGDFLPISEAFFRSFSDVQPSRLGLRYINQLKSDMFPETDPLEWSPFVKDELLGLFRYKVEGAKPARIFHNCEYVFGDDFNLRMQFGIHNPDFPAEIRQRIFILDFDAYHKGLVEHSAIKTELDSLHTSIQRLFEDCITPHTRDKLNESAT